MQHLRVRRGIRGSETAVIGGEEHLANLFVGAHFAQRRFYPLRCGRREMPICFRSSLFLGASRLCGGRAALCSRGMSHKKKDCGGNYEQNAEASFPQM